MMVEKLNGLGVSIACLVTFATVGPVQAGHELAEGNATTGELQYLEHCASCHGEDLQGEPDWRSPGKDGFLPAPPHSKDGHTWHHGNRLLFDYTKLGGKEALAQRGVEGFNSAMPGFGDELTDDAIWDILAYIWSTWPQQVQESQHLRNPPHE